MILPPRRIQRPLRERPPAVGAASGAARSSSSSISSNPNSPLRPNPASAVRELGALLFESGFKRRDDAGASGRAWRRRSRALGRGACEAHKAPGHFKFPIFGAESLKLGFEHFAGGGAQSRPDCCPDAGNGNDAAQRAADKGQRFLGDSFEHAAEPQMSRLCGCPSKPF